jgi:hypothetical protein
MEHPELETLWIVAAGSVLIAITSFVVLMVAMQAAFAWGGGWRRLATRYRAIAPPVGPVLKRQTVRVGAVRYRRLTTVGLYPEGVYLAVGLPFHPAVWIPWGEWGLLRETRIDLGTPAVELAVGEPALARVTVTRALYEQMAPYLW